MKNKKNIKILTSLLALSVVGCGNKKETLPTPASSGDNQTSSLAKDVCGEGSKASISTPPAETIIEKSLAAMGGKEALMQIKTLEARDCDLEIAPMGLKGKSTSLHRTPSSYKMTQELVGVGKTEAGYDGNTAWEMSSMTGSRIVEGEEKLGVIESTDLYKDANWKKYYKSATNDGIVTVGGKAAFKVNFARDNGKDVSRYYDSKTFYLLKEEREDTTQMGVIKSEMNFDDYREVAGVLMAHKVTVNAASATVLMNCPNIVANKEIDDSEFNIPEEISKLQK